MIILGIDPDLKASGVAVVSGKAICQLKNVRFCEMLEFLAQFDKERVLIKIENPEANKGLFAAQSNKNKAVSIRVATNVGQVMAVTRLLHEMLEHAGYTVKLVRPIRGPMKMQAKTDAAYFNKITGWTGKSNADQRDAAIVAIYG